MKIENPEVDLNKEAFAKYMAIPGKKKRFVAFIDGDIVEKWDDFNFVSLTASGLRSQRGPGTQMDVFNTETGSSLHEPDDGPDLLEDI